MIDQPTTIVSDGFQSAWAEAVKALHAVGWDMRNLVVHVRCPGKFDGDVHTAIDDFALKNGLLLPRHVAYTIFPHGLYDRLGNASALFSAYNRRNGMFERLHRRKPSWGTYFRRMTSYCVDSMAPVNQLERILASLRNRRGLHKAAYTIVIQYPGGETVRPRGGPCLNYLAVQAAPTTPPTIGLLAVYRNHCFLERAYGNYWGLCNLASFLAREAGASVGPVTCISSRAFVESKKAALLALMEQA